MENDKSTIQFLSASGLSGIETGKVIRTSSSSAINDDYRNRNYFVLVRFTRIEFDQFIAANAFKREDVLAVPARGSTRPKVPDWWEPPMKGSVLEL